MGIFDKSLQVLDGWLDERISKAKVSTAPAPEPAYDRKGLIDIEYGNEQQWGWKERRGLIGPPVLRNMARRDSIVAAIIETRTSQVIPFTKPQADRYSPGFKICAVDPADLSREDKLKLADPELEEEEYQALKYEMEKKRTKLQNQQDDEVKKITKFILNCGEEPTEDAQFTRIDFDECVKLWISDRLTYNYTATEFIPNKMGDKLHHWYPVGAGTVRYVSRRSAELYEKTIKQALDLRFARLTKDVPADRADAAEFKAAYDKESKKPFRFVQVVQGRVEAAWTDAELLFQAGKPTVDPEDNGYSPGELETLLQIVTAHLYAEAHNRNYFTQGIGGKGLLHIKGQNLSRGQLEGFKRQWFNQLASTRNAFRPPIIGLADEVKWIELAQSNKDMEFDNWMNYLIKVMCAIYQMDPAEINFDITKQTTSTLNEGNNEERLKSSKDKGLRPLLDYIENIVNRAILPKWDPKLAEKYKFQFVGLDAETREQEMKRLETETKVWKTLNEARVEMGKAPIEHGDLVLNATYTQYLQMKEQAMQAGMMPGQDGAPPDGQEPEPQEGDKPEDDKALFGELSDLEKQADKEIAGDKKDEEKKAKAEETKKSDPIVVEYLSEDE